MDPFVFLSFGIIRLKRLNRSPGLCDGGVSETAVDRYVNTWRSVAPENVKGLKKC